MNKRSCSSSPKPQFRLGGGSGEANAYHGEARKVLRRFAMAAYLLSQVFVFACEESSTCCILWPSWLLSKHYVVLQKSCLLSMESTLRMPTKMWWRNQSISYWRNNETSALSCCMKQLIIYLLHGWNKIFNCFCILLVLNSLNSSKNPKSRMLKSRELGGWQISRMSNPSCLTASQKKDHPLLNEKVHYLVVWKLACSHLLLAIWLERQAKLYLPWNLWSHPLWLKLLAWLLALHEDDFDFFL